MRFFQVALSIVLASLPCRSLADECFVTQLNQCQGNDIDTPASFESARWFTPEKSDNDYFPSFQSYSHLAAWAQVLYTDSSHSKAKVIVHTICADPSCKLTYTFGGVDSSVNQMDFDGATKGPITLTIRDQADHTITLDEIDFLWNAAPLPSLTGDYRNGQKGAIVEMFGWPHGEIEKECGALAKMGYLGVKLYPAMEQLMSTEPFNNILNPWYFMYQPVSYRMYGRMGTRDDLRSLINTCRSLGVRVYADAVINHMTGGGNDVNPHHRNPSAACTTWGAKSSSLPGGPSPMYTQNYVWLNGTHTGTLPSQEYPAAAYGPQDFHCERALNAWTDPLDLNAGWLTGLTDLNTERANVQDRIAAYLTDLLSLGFSGFRVDAAKHIRPEDLAAIFSKVALNMGGSLPDDFIAYLEVLLGGESDLLMCNAQSGYNYGIGLENLLKSAGLSQVDVNKIKIWNSGYPKEPQKGFCTISPLRSAIQNDDSDQQTPGSSSRDMADTGCVLIMPLQFHGCSGGVGQHRQYEITLFKNPPGATDNNNDYPIRLVLSSFYFPNTTALGIPDGKSDCALCQTNCANCQGVSFVPAFNDKSVGYDGSLSVVDYTRVHRDNEIVNAMRAWLGLQPITVDQYTNLAK